MQQQKVLFSCPKPLHAQNQFMGFIDMVNFDKRSEVHFQPRDTSKNGTRKDFWKILDFMLVNEKVAWNMSTYTIGIIRVK